MKPSKYRNVRVEPSESQSQAAVIQWWALACKGYGLPEFALFSVPNGAVLAGNAQRRAIQMNNLKRTGLRAGVPDLFLAAPSSLGGENAGGEWLAGLFIEMKRKGNKPSPEQAAVIMYLRTHGYHCVVAMSSDEAIQAIKGYLA